MNTQTHKASNSSREIVRGKFKREKKKNEKSPYFINLNRPQLNLFFKLLYNT